MRHPIRSICALVAVGSIAFQAGVFVAADEASTSARFERAKQSGPQLVAFLKEMPKGADLHNHASGAVYAETRLDAAIDSDLYFDPKTSTFSTQQTEGAVPAKQLLTELALAAQYLNATSMRGNYPAVRDGHDHFFNTFDLFGVPSAVLNSDVALAGVIARNEAQNVQYMELMTGTAPGDAVQAAMSDPPPIEDMQKALETMRARLPAFLEASRRFLDRRDSELAKLVGVDPPITGVDGPINIRYIFSVYRLSPNPSFFAQMACGMALVQSDPRIVAVNILAPEDDVMARRNFDTQMKIIDFLWPRFGKPDLTLHAGELTLEYSPVEPMRSRIRKSIELGHARRIGHGVSIAWEDDLPELLEKMREQGIAVEVCLTSNDGILRVSGDRHPFNLYRESGVPITINTDDEGVNRSNLTMEFVRAVRTYDLSYKDVKELVRNSIEYSFLPGASLYRNRNYSDPSPEFGGVRDSQWVPSGRAREMMADSQKLTVQVRLERAFAEFEN